MGCVNSVQDKDAVGTLTATNGAASGHWDADARAAVAEVLGATTSVTVELSVKCTNLPDKDVFSKSDPMGVLLAADGSGSAWSEVARTNIIANTLSPAFAPVRCTYSFERLQPMKLVVFDVETNVRDAAAVKLSASEHLGEAQFLLSDLLTAQGQTLALQLRDARGRPAGTAKAIISAEELPMANAVVSVSLAAQQLDNVETFSKSDPFVRISKMRENSDFVPVVKTEVVPNNLSPAWRPFKASMAQLCNCDPHRPLLLEVFDAEKSGAHRLIGAWQGSLQALQDAAAAGQGLPITNPRKAGKPGYVSSGTLLPRSVQVEARPSFLDYIKGGVSLNFLVAIDFTASNGQPTDPASLHYTARGHSIYERAIEAVGGVISHYGTDQRFPAWGFGAALPPSGTASHCFALNGTPASPEVEGVEGLLRAYRQALQSVRLSGPTLFAPVISTAAQVAAQPSSTPQYYVLLIITDGCIMDMQNTLQAIVDATELPLSLLIVGVGDADFTAMEVLDGDEQRLRAPSGKLAARDCVQFVPFKQATSGGRTTQRDAVEELACQLLAELPGQLVEYFYDMRRIPPPARPTAPPPPAVAADAFYGA